MWLWGAGLAAAVVLFLFVQMLGLAFVLRWEDEQTIGLNYYGRSPDERLRFKRSLRRFARLLAPAIWLNGRLGTLDFRKSRIVYKGVSAPTGSCSMESFALGESYEPGPSDLFIVTQMKCGTTWMQQIAYEVLLRGAGDLAGSGTTLYAISPWLEGRKSVATRDAPRVGHEHPMRIIKTHFPAQLCPFRYEARYIYVARHPVSCFASCIDFVHTNVGALAPAPAAFEEWFCSRDLMWWSTWSEHVAGWWHKAQQEPNVLFVHFEDMKRDLPSVVRRVADFLGLTPLDDSEVARIVHKCGFDYMQQHQDVFEMHPPHILQTNAALFVSGAANRHQDVPVDVTGRILEWASRGLAANDIRLQHVYPDLAAAATPSSTPARA
jgi:hypothetical protein